MKDKKDKIRISFELTKHEAALTRHWLAKQRLDSYPTPSIAKTMSRFYNTLATELYNEQDS